MHRRRGRKVHFLRCLHAYNVWAQSNTHWRTCTGACVRFTSLLAKNRDFRSVHLATIVRCPIRKNACIWSFGCTGGAVEKYIFFDVYTLTMFGRKVTHIGERAPVFVCGLRHFWRKIVTSLRAFCHNRSICLLHVWTACSFFCRCGQYVLGVLCFWSIASSKACPI